MPDSFPHIHRWLSKHFRKHIILWQTSDLKSPSINLFNTNIIQFFHVINTLNSMYVVMKYLEGEDLEKVIRE